MSSLALQIPSQRVALPGPRKKFVQTVTPTLTTSGRTNISLSALKLPLYPTRSPPTQFGTGGPFGLCRPEAICHSPERSACLVRLLACTRAQQR